MDAQLPVPADPSRCRVASLPRLRQRSWLSSSADGGSDIVGVATNDPKCLRRTGVLHTVKLATSQICAVVHRATYQTGRIRMNTSGLAEGASSRTCSLLFAISVFVRTAELVPFPFLTRPDVVKRCYWFSRPSVPQTCGSNEPATTSGWTAVPGRGRIQGGTLSL